MSKFRSHKMPFIAALLVLCLLANFTPAQRNNRGRGQGSGKQHSTAPPVYEVPKNQDDTSGRFTFARIRFDAGLLRAGNPLGDYGPMWSHDYPDAGRHLMKIVSEFAVTRY